MVSTRGVKVKFIEGERVLCYEPDPTKAKVLYDSKVLGVIVKKDSRGKKFVEYMIHFQGWNSSWDRSVSEEYVLKDTPENRQLQRDLAEKSQLHIGQYLYRKERKKHNNRSSKSSEKVGQSSEDGSCGSPAMMDDVDGNASSSSSEEESSGEEEQIEIELNQTLKKHLEKDYFNIKTHNKLHKLPSSPNVVQIIEEYYKFYATKQYSSLHEKPSSRRYSYNNGVKVKPEDVQRRLNLCKEVLDGLRIQFDFVLGDILLYAPEDGQITTVPTRAANQLNDNSIKTEPTSTVKNEVEDQEYAHLPVVDDDENLPCDSESSSNLMTRSLRRRKLRSSKNQDSTTNGTANNDAPKTRNSHPSSSNNHSDTNGITIKFPVWKAVPEVAYSQNPPPPCLVYGVTHFLRFFVKLPTILSSSTISEDKMKIVVEHAEKILSFITDRSDWLDNVTYIDAS